MARAGSLARLSAEWRAWLTENLLLGVSREDLIATLVDNDVPAAIAAREIDLLARSPVLFGARRVTRFVKRHALVTRMRRELEKISSLAGTVERRSRVSSEEFYDRYYAGNAPLVLADALEPWPAARAWSPEQLKARFGDVEVETTDGREADPLYEPNFQAHARTGRFADFLDRIARGPTNDVYLIANNRLTKRAGMEPLLADVGAPHPLLNERRDGDCVSIWIGPAGTVTPLHHDTANVLICQVYGRKKLILFPSFELSLTHDAHHGVHSPVDAECPDLDAFPQLEEATRKEVVLGPGEGVFIPIGWFHHVRALETSISVSFTNFRAPNRFDWFFPGQIEA